MIVHEFPRIDTTLEGQRADVFDDPILRWRLLPVGRMEPVGRLDQQSDEQAGRAFGCFNHLGYLVSFAQLFAGPVTR